MTTWLPRVLVIGAGAGGIAAAVRLRQDGVRDLLVVDRADGLGGVWRANVYPGAQCDVPSHLYSLSFHPKPDWSKRFADQEEILGYLEDVADTHGLQPYLRMRTEVTACTWDENAQLWRVDLRSVDDGTSTQVEADVVIAATGQLSTPACPSLPGLDRFAGPMFHSARWRHDVDLAGQRVGVIGTGASAAQFVPVIARTTAHLVLFQRSAPYIIGKLDRPYTERETRSYARVPGLLRFSRWRQYLWHELLGIPFTAAPVVMRWPARGWRKRLERVVEDPQLRARLTPDYTMGCKRILLSRSWYRTLTRPDVSVITDDIVEVRTDRVRTKNGDEHRLDVLILGTGFKATRFLAPIRVTGRGGESLASVWADGARAYLGIMVPKFPNFFLVYGPGTNVGHTSVLFMIESQLAWIRSALRTMRRRDLRWIEVKPEVQSRYDAWFSEAGAGTVWESGCDSWYTQDGRNLNNWPGTTVAYRWRTRRFRVSDIISRRSDHAVDR